METTSYSTTRKPTVLVIDDEPLARNHIKLLLELMGGAVVTEEENGTRVWN